MFFAWTYTDMRGISPDIAYHALNVDPRVLFVEQKNERNGLRKVYRLNGGSRQVIG